MNKREKIREMLAKGETVYMADDFYEMALRFYKDADGQTVYFRKFRKGAGIAEEQPIDIKESATAFEVTLGGKFITKEEYEAYDL